MARSSKRNLHHRVAGGQAKHSSRPPSLADRTPSGHISPMASPTTAPDPDAPLRRSLARHRAFATGLLVLMAALAVFAYWLPPTLGALFLRDAAKAGVIGGIADWFAVTALFRHPLGLPIPHTAILPAQKERLGAALGRFVANHVFTEADVARFLEGLDIPDLLGRFLADPALAQPMAETLAGSLPRLLQSVEDGRARKLVGRLLPRIAGGPAAGRVVARALASLVQSGRHQEVFSFILEQLRAMLQTREAELKTIVRERVREQGGMLVGWAVGANIAAKVVTALNTELDRVGPDGSELRAAFDEWVGREITRLTEDPARAAELGAALRTVVTHESMRAWGFGISGRGCAMRSRMMRCGRGGTVSR
jgi:Predicted membrane protein